MMAQGERLRTRRAKTAADVTAYVKRILDEVGKSLFEKYELVGMGEDLIHFSAFGK